MGNEIWGADAEAREILGDEKLSAKCKWKRIEAIHARLMTSLVVHLGALTLEVGGMLVWEVMVGNHGEC